MAQDLDGCKVAILVAEGFEQVELTEPKKALEQAGAQTKIVSPAKDQVQGWHHFDKGDKFPSMFISTKPMLMSSTPCCCPGELPIPINFGRCRRPSSSCAAFSLRGGRWRQSAMARGR